MAKIDWDEFKEYKQELPKGMDNFKALLEFLRSFYNKISPFEVFDILNEDELGSMMLKKRSIKKPEHLEKYLYKKLAK